MNENQLDKSYIVDLQTIKETIRENRHKTLVVVNSAMILTYYRIGTIINERKEWGNKYIQRLAEGLKEFGRGYSYPQLKRMSQFARTFSIDEIGSQVGTQIPWRTIVEIMSKSSSREEILWYIKQTYENRWSRRMVIEQFRYKAYERKIIEPLVTEAVAKDEELKEVFKDALSFDFLESMRLKMKELNNTIKNKTPYASTYIRVIMRLDKDIRRTIYEKTCSFRNSVISCSIDRLWWFLQNTYHWI